MFFNNKFYEVSNVKLYLNKVPIYQNYSTKANWPTCKSKLAFGINKVIVKSKAISKSIIHEKEVFDG